MLAIKSQKEEKNQIKKKILKFRIKNLIAKESKSNNHKKINNNKIPILIFFYLHKGLTPTHFIQQGYRINSISLKITLNKSKTKEIFIHVKN